MFNISVLRPSTHAAVPCCDGPLCVAHFVMASKHYFMSTTMSGRKHIHSEYSPGHSKLDPALEYIVFFIVDSVKGHIAVKYSE